VNFIPADDEKEKESKQFDFTLYIKHIKQLGDKIVRLLMSLFTLNFALMESNDTFKCKFRFP
jgi:hypothetical protein